MPFIDAVFRCKIRGYIARKSKPHKNWWKNHPVRLEDRIPIEEQKTNDWETFDPEGDATSVIG